MATTDSPRMLVQAYYDRLDAGRNDLLDLFSEDCQIYFPKFGVARGKSGFSALLAGLLTRIKSIQHDRRNLLFIVDGNRVAVEGTTNGELTNGAAWAGGRTPGGRFSSIFEVKDGLISRMFVYLDPDYGSDDQARFLWGTSSERSW